MCYYSIHTFIHNVIFQDHNAKQLSEWCLHFIAKNFETFQSRPEFRRLTDEHRTFVEEHQWPPQSYTRVLERYWAAQRKCVVMWSILGCSEEVCCHVIDIGLLRGSVLSCDRYRAAERKCVVMWSILGCSEEVCCHVIDTGLLRGSVLSCDRYWAAQRKCAVMWSILGRSEEVCCHVIDTGLLRGSVLSCDRYWAAERKCVVIWSILGCWEEVCCHVIDTGLLRGGVLSCDRYWEEVCCHVIDTGLLRGSVLSCDRYWAAQRKCVVLWSILGCSEEVRCHVIDTGLLRGSVLSCDRYWAAQRKCVVMWSILGCSEEVCCYVRANSPWAFQRIYWKMLYCVYYENAFLGALLTEIIWALFKYLIIRRNKMVAIFRTTLSNAFPWMKMYKFRLRFHWNLFLRVQLTMFQPWFR